MSNCLSDRKRESSHDLRDSRAQHREVNRVGVGLIEFIFVIAIIGLVLTLLLPAVQSIRESARATQCASNLRTIAMSTLLQSDALRHLPESRVVFDAYGVPLQEQLWGKFIGGLLGPSRIDLQSFSRSDAPGYCHVPAVFLCPASIPTEMLDRLPRSLADQSMVDAEVETCDYRGNRGVIDPFTGSSRATHRGVYSVVRDGGSKRTIASITDGLSGTLLMWETVGSRYARQKQFEPVIVLKEWATSGKVFSMIQFDDDPLQRTFRIPQGRGLLGYIHGWSGFGSGQIHVITLGPQAAGGRFERRFLDNNEHGDPFSLHRLGINVAFCDGHVGSINHNIDFEPLAMQAGIDDEVTVPGSGRIWGE